MHKPAGWIKHLKIMRKFALASVLMLFSVSLIWGWECGHAPPAKSPQHIKAGESFPPLPLPATPLRRSERKNPPAPPILVGKVRCGPDETWTRADNDVENLLKLATQQLGLAYSTTWVDLNRFSYDPDEVPILYITSVEPFIPTETMLKNLKEYLEKGGFLWVNASSGSPDFMRSMMEWINKLYPDRNMYPIYANHPLKNCFYNLASVNVLKENQPSTSDLNLRVLDIGCRAAVILSPFDLGCGWAMHTHPWGSRYVPEDAVKIGMNMITYCLGWIEFGRLYGMTPVFAEKTKRKEGKLYVGQIIHSGDWDPHPASLGKLLRKVAEQTSASVYLDRINVDLKKDSLKDVPLLYMTGHFNPNLSSEEVKKLRDFLLSGGSLIADACCGSQEFADSFRAMMKTVLPEAKPVTWDAQHAIYKVPFNIQKFLYSFPNENRAPLEIYILKGLPAVVFSPYGLGGGWDGTPRPYTRELASEQAQQLGVNIITYLMTN
jgi:hypothetical protein